MLLGLNGLMQALGVPTAEHQTAGELVHNDDLAVLDDVVHVPLHDAVGLDGLIDVVGDGAVLRVGEVLQIEKLLGLGDTTGGEGGRLGLLIHHIVGVDILGFLLFGVYLRHHVFLHPGHQRLRHVIQLRGLVAHAGDDEGRPGLIDEDGVHLVHDGEVMAPLHLLVLIDGHVVPQVVKAHLVVGAVGDVGVVGGLPLLLAEVVDDQAHRQAQKAVDLAHPFAVSLGQIVVDGDDVNATARQCIEVGGQRGHQRLTFTGLHLSDTALMQHDAADELHPIGTQTQHTVRCLPHGGKGLRQQVIQRLTVGQTLLELRGLGLKLGIGEGLVLVGQRLDLVSDGVDAFQLPLTVRSENFRNESHMYRVLSVSKRKVCVLLPFPCRRAGEPSGIAAASRNKNTSCIIPQIPVRCKGKTATRAISLK